MKNSLGTSVIFTLFGESHQDYIGGVLDGLTPGIKVDENFIKEMLKKRRPSFKTDTSRIENDDFEIISGVFNGYTDGSPLTILIRNQNKQSGDYTPNIPRPSHADYVAHQRYHGFNDYRGGGHFSGRLTAPIVAIGSICLKALEEKGIKIATHIKKCGDFKDDEIKNLEEDINIINSKEMPIISNNENKLEEEILKAKNDADSIGGITETFVSGLPLGVGEPWFSSLEGEISRAMFALGGVKGIEFGEGFNFANGRGSSFNDEYYYDSNKIVKTRTNHNGGINGGISNGEPIVFSLAIKPTPSIGKEQNTIDLNKEENIVNAIKGRHDPAIIRRICVVITSLLAIVLADQLQLRFGVDYFRK